MTVTPGWTSEEIREFVYEYERQPFGAKRAFRDERGVSESMLRRWRRTVFDGDLDRGLVPRPGGEATGTVLRRRIAWHQVDRDAEVEELRGQVRRLEEVNQALGKAIGLLQSLSGAGPQPSTTSAPGDSSRQKTSL